MQLANSAELQIDHLRSIEAAEATVAARCIRGPVHLGAHFDHITDPAAPVDLKLTGIIAFGRAVDSLDPVHAALVTLRGSGIHLLRAGDATRGWQRIQGSNSNPLSLDHAF